MKTSGLACTETALGYVHTNVRHCKLVELVKALNVSRSELVRFGVDRPPSSGPAAIFV